MREWHCRRERNCSNAWQHAGKLTIVSDGSWPNWDEAKRWLRGKFAVPKADAGDGLKPAGSGRVRPAARGRCDARL